MKNDFTLTARESLTAIPASTVPAAEPGLSLKLLSIETWCPLCSLQSVIPATWANCMVTCRGCLHAYKVRA